MKKLKKIISFVTLTLAAMLMSIPCSADTVSGTLTSIWGDIKGEVKTIANNIVFPACDVILAVLVIVFAVKAAINYRKGQDVELTGVIICVIILIFTLTAPLYIWNVLPA